MVERRITTLQCTNYRGTYVPAKPPGKTLILAVDAMMSGIRIPGCQHGGPPIALQVIIALPGI